MPIEFEKGTKMKSFKPMTAFLLAAAFAASPVVAQTGAPVPVAKDAATNEKPAVMKDAAEGEVRKFDKDAKKITLKHGPIKNLDMPGMTMVFQVKDANLMDKLALLAVGDKILFTAEQQQGAYVVTGAEKAATK
jgi:Cu(I)/Ag(I) efflux system periplasmic protein CusF